MLVGQIRTSLRDDATTVRRRCAPSCPAEPHAVAKREDGIENGADGIGKRPAIHYGDRRSNFASTAEERARSVSISGSPTVSPSTTGKMCRPDFGLGGRATPPRRQDGAILARYSVARKVWKRRVCRVAAGGASTSSA